MRPFEAVQILKTRDDMHLAIDGLKDALLISAQAIVKFKDVPLTKEHLHALSVWSEVLAIQVRHVGECIRDTEQSLARIPR